jgi:hypothetical protein
MIPPNTTLVKYDNPQQQLSKSPVKKSSQVRAVLFCAFFLR